MTATYQTRSIEYAVGEMAGAHAPPAANADALRVISDAMTSPLALDGWLEFNRVRWEVRPLRVRLGEDGSEVPAAHAVYYLDRRGRVWAPPTNLYLPLEFESTPTQSLARLDRQWLNVGHLLAEDMKSRGVAGRIMLPPEIEDIRPWQWTGFAATVRYRFHLELPCSESLLDHAGRWHIARLARAGFSHERVSGFADVVRCLKDTEQRQGFPSGMTLSDLELAADLLGDDVLRAYVCYAPTGEPASARIILHREGGRAIDWLSGTSNDYLRSGAARFLLSRVLADVHAHGATGFDGDDTHLPGMSIPGGRRVPSYVIEAPDVLGLARNARVQWQYWRARWEERRA